MAVCLLLVAFAMEFLNQARVSQRPVRTWFLEIAFVHKVSICVCVSAPRL